MPNVTDKNILSIFLPRLSTKTLDIRDTLNKLAHWSTKFSPIANIDTAHYRRENLNLTSDTLSHGINIDITASLQLFKGKNHILNSIAKKLTSLHFNFRLAIAPTLGCAWAISRYGSEDIAIACPHSLFEVLTPLPIQALRLDDHTLKGLHEVGITHVEHLLKVEPDALAERFGPFLTKRLQQALGLEEELIDPIKLATPLIAKRDFEEPLKLIDAIEAAVKQLVEDILLLAKRESRNIRSLMLEFGYKSMPSEKRDILLSFPSCDFKHIWFLLRPKLEHLELHAEVIFISLTITDTATKDFDQGEMFLKSFHADKAVNVNKGKLLDTLINELGSEQVAHAHFHASHIPERSFSFAPLARNYLTHTLAEHSLLTTVEEHSLTTTTRPSVLFRQPEIIQTDAVTAELAPSWLQWQGIFHSIAQMTGPERIFPEWWRSHSFATSPLDGSPTKQHSGSRDYFTVQTQDGTWLWIFRDLNTSQWFLHGIWA